MAKHEFGIMMNTPRQKRALHIVGVTLVPPCSLKAFIDSIADIPELCELKKLFKKALEKINGLFITEFD